MVTLRSSDIQRRIGIVRKVLQAGDELLLTFHDKPAGKIVPHDQLEAERAELARLRTEVEALPQLRAELEALRAQLNQHLGAA